MDGILIVSLDQGIYANSQGPMGRGGRERKESIIASLHVFKTHLCFHSLPAIWVGSETAQGKINGSPEPHPSYTL